ncbi:DNA-processing protein DprA [Sphingomonas sp. MMS24-J13]|uniref:DNA-processing protein DprA n=1 Tax=Sphingomonas sp. MMS24-J13 TaxID=3238686 RepID=UPI00384E8781
MSADTLARLRLIRTRSIGPISYFQLLQRFGSAQSALDAIPDLARRGGGTLPRIPSPAEIEREAETVASLGARYLICGDPDYPALLAEVDTAPPALIVAGDVALANRPCVAMVGARNASAAAVRFARMLAHDLVEHGLVVVSGLARGIDTAAHDGSLDRATIGVIAGGIDIVYPPENDRLQRAIAHRGLLVAEQPPGTEPRARHFPYRNRIIAGMGQGTVVVEAAPKSGSLITARLAAEYGRDVMAVPGSPLDPRAQGCNLLIRDGATLIQSAADVIETLRPFGRDRVAAPKIGFEGPVGTGDASDRDRRAVVELLSQSAVATDEVIRQSGMPSALVQTVLLELELAGRIDRHAGGRVSLR